WLNASDADAEKWIRIFTFLSLAEIEKVIAMHESDPSRRHLQKILAKEITVFVHGQEEFEKALATTEKLFNTAGDGADYSEEDLRSIEGVVKSDFFRHKLSPGIDLVSFLAETNIFPSKGEARRTVQGGGVSINRKKIADPQMQVDHTLLLHDKYILVQKGKKNYFLVEMI
ncbi:MAG TPA: S4 domain-containing protein, partial [Chitinophagaceae bacterium]